MRFRRAGVGAALLGALTAASAPRGRTYSTQTPYAPQQDLRSYERPPRGVTPGKDRAVDSGNNFAASLGERVPGLAPLIDPPVVNPDLLYFHKQPQNADYQDWLAHDPTLASTLASIDYGERSHDQARRL